MEAPLERQVAEPLEDLVFARLASESLPEVMVRVLRTRTSGSEARRRSPSEPLPTALPIRLLVSQHMPLWTACWQEGTAAARQLRALLGASLTVHRQRQEVRTGRSTEVQAPAGATVLLMVHITVLALAALQVATALHLLPAQEAHLVP